MLDEGDFIAQATRAGFDGKMAQFMYDSLAQVDHEHTSDEIITQERPRETLDDALDAIDEALEEDEEEETEEVED